MVKIAICDDDLFFLGKFDLIVRNAFTKFNFEIYIEKYLSGEELIKDLEFNHKIFDIILLDVDMPFVDGFKVADRLRQLDKNFILIFITNMKEYAVKGYKYNAFRYIFKEHLDEEFEETINEIFKDKTHNYDDTDIITFKVKVNNCYEFIKVNESDIIRLYKEGRRTFIDLIYGTYELLQYNLRHYKYLINKEHFIIVSRAHLVNLRNIVDLKGDFFKLSNGQTVSIGTKENIKNEVKSKYANYRIKRI